MRILLTTVALASATPALAHAGSHAHPHGLETFATVAALVAVAIAAYKFGRSRG